MTGGALALATALCAHAGSSPIYPPGATLVLDGSPALTVPAGAHASVGVGGGVFGITTDDGRVFLVIRSVPRLADAPPATVKAQVAYRWTRDPDTPTTDRSPRRIQRWSYTAMVERSDVVLVVSGSAGRDDRDRAEALVRDVAESLRGEPWPASSTPTASDDAPACLETTADPYPFRLSLHADGTVHYATRSDTVGQDGDLVNRYAHRFTTGTWAPHDAALWLRWGQVTWVLDPGALDAQGLQPCADASAGRPEDLDAIGAGVPGLSACLVPVVSRAEPPQRLTLRFQIAADGTPGPVALEPAALSDAAVDACLTEAIAAVPFAPSDAPRAVAYPLVLRD